MSQRTRQLLGALLLCFCLAFAAGVGVHQLWGELGQAERSKPLGLFWEAWTLVEESFYGKLPSPQERTYGAIHEALVLLDNPYTVFVEPQPRELERDRMRGSFGGIGVALWRDTEGRMALLPYADSPAERAGIIKGDALLALDGEEISELTTVDDVSARLHDEVGLTVTLTISRPPTLPFNLTIAREEIKVPSITWRMLEIEQPPDVGYINIESFTERTGDEITTAIQELQTEGSTSLVLDLRDNRGGLIDPAVATASQFFRDGVVLFEVTRDTEERVIEVQPGGIAADIPLVVLVNGGTASAAEIVAGALQDHGRALLIGEPTFGKGSVQLIYEISDGSSVHVTSAIWLTPDRNQIEGVGLMPDVRIACGDGPRDEQLDRAVIYLK
ncbi:MAG: S41 family peptidase [Chloroflexota bacterium]|nr:S41 family peptidase [Chloroflexota bacterium]